MSPSSQYAYGNQYAMGQQANYGYGGSYPAGWNARTPQGYPSGYGGYPGGYGGYPGGYAGYGYGLSGYGGVPAGYEYGSYNHQWNGPSGFSGYPGAAQKDQAQGQPSQGGQPAYANRTTKAGTK